MYLKHNIIVITLTLAAITANAASFRVQAPNQVPAGSAFTVEFILENGEGTDLSLPDLEGAEKLFGPNVSKSMSTTIINGKMSSNYSRIYTVYYQAVRPGRHTLGSASVMVEGKRLTTQPVTIEILDVGSTPSPQSQMPQQSAPMPTPAPTPSPGPTQPNNTLPSNGITDPNAKGKDLFVSVNLSKDVIYEQEAVVCTIKLYSRLKGSISDISCTQQPKFNGFLIEELPVSHLSQAVEVNGERYVSADLQKFILFPQETGKLSITTGKYEAEYVASYDPFDNFFGFGTSAPSVVSVPSTSITVDIKPLPSPRPANFSGAVGEFSVITRLKPSSFKTYAPATYSIIVSGNGNLKYIQNPVVNMPKQFDTYDPQSKIKMVPNDENASGSVTFDYLFIPQYEGNFKIPDSYFVFFNTVTQRYDSVKVDGYNLKVEKGEGKPSEHYKLSNMDIRDINKNNEKLSKSQSFFITSPVYWIAALLSIIALVAGLIAYTKMEKTRANTTLMRTRRASKLAQRRLKTANALMLKNDRNGFYTETLTALWGYLSDKLNIPVSELSKDNIATEMTAFGFSQQHINETMQMLETCEFAQYAPELDGGNMAQVYNDSAMLIDKLESVKRTKANVGNINMRTISIILLMALSLPAMASGADLVEEGNKAYEAKQYRKAIELYEKAAKDGASSQLYYNLGNAYYRSKDRAHAILNYERALKLSPSNGDARYNLEFVCEKAQLVDDNGSTYFSSLIGDLVSHASSNAWAVIAFIALLLCLAGIACYRIADDVTLQKVGFFGAIAMAVIIVLAVICSVYMFNRSTSNDKAIIMVDKTPVQKSPRANEKDVAFSLTNGVKVEIVDSIADKGSHSKWYKIETSDNRTGWTTHANFEII